MIKVFVVIPAFNNRDTVLERLECLQQQTYREFQVVLIDDGSTDGTVDEVQRRYPQTLILQGDGNLWWTGAMVMGVEYVLALGADDDFVLALNNDLTFGAELLETLLEGSRKYPEAIVSSVVYDAAHRERVIDAGQFLDWRTSATQLQPGRDANLHVNVTSGRGVLLPLSVFRRAGNYNARLLPHYYADFEMALRAQRHGFRLVTYYPAKVYLRDDSAGLGENLFKHRTLREIWEIASSPKSFRRVPSLLGFLIVACPWSHVPKMVIKESGYAFWIYTGFTPLYQLRKPLEVVCRALFAAWYRRHSAVASESQS